MRIKQLITSINGFSIGDKVRLLDGDGREHIIKSFSIEGLNEFFFEVQFEDGSWTMLDNIELLHSTLDEAADKFAVFYDQGTCDGIAQDCFKAGVEWQKSQMKMPNSPELISAWHEVKSILQEKDFRGDEWRLAYNAFMFGFSKGLNTQTKKK